MKLLLPLLLLLPLTLAFPYIPTKLDLSDPEVQQLITLVKSIGFNTSNPAAASEYEELRRIRKRATVTTYPFEEISVTGPHAFVPPGPGDQRGPCPGLNALANHGYIPHNGVVGLIQVVEACTEVYGLGVDLGLVLSVIALTMSGDLVSRTWSIGGPPPGSGGLIGGLLGAIIGRGRGLTYSHNRFESDASGAGWDWWQSPTGTADDIELVKFRKLLDWKTGTNPDYNDDVNVLNKHRKFTLDRSVGGNPYFFLGPFTVLVSSAGHVFVPRMFSSFTPAFPKGRLEKRTLFDFFAVEEHPTTKVLTAKKGWNRIPTNWWRRPHNLPNYGTLPFVQDLIAMAAVNPAILKIGGNTGTVNSFAGVDLGSLTGGVYNLVDLANPNKFVCYIYQLVSVAVPDVLSGGLIGGVLDLVTDLLQTIIAPLMDPTCPGINVYNSQLLNQFPGLNIGQS